jgi:tetratricopeptide (TPR) repeat protein
MGTMHRNSWSALALRAAALTAAVLTVGANVALAQYPGQGGGMPGGGRGGQQSIVPPGDEPGSQPVVVKPDVAATKAYKAGMKSLAKARDAEAALAAATTSDKKANALEKMNDDYTQALDQFTEALRNNGDMVDAWNNVGYVHLRLGAYNEAVDDYNHALKLQPDLMGAIAFRAEAYLALDHLEDAKIDYMNLESHAPQLAAEVMAAMQKWLAAHRIDARGMRASDIEAFDKWLRERDNAKQAALPH